MKFAALILFFNSEKTILRCIDNCANFVDRIYISYSKEPWIRYNASSRDLYQNHSDLSIISKSLHIAKIKVVEGIWDSEEDQRNAVIAVARLEQIDFLIIQDSDEFYLETEYAKNIKAMLKEPSYPFYYTPWINFWKDLNHVLLERQNLFGSRFSIYSVSANFALNLRKFPNAHFKERRLPNYLHDQGCKLPGICYHLSYVHSDEDIRIKLGTWGHSHQVHSRWLEFKWFGWTPQTTYLHPLEGPVWQKVVKFDGVLPKELEGFPSLAQDYIPLTGLQRFLEIIYNNNQLKNYVIQKLKALLAKKFKLGQYKVKG